MPLMFIAKQPYLAFRQCKLHDIFIFGMTYWNQLGTVIVQVITFVPYSNERVNEEKFTPCAKPLQNRSRNKEFGTLRYEE